MGTTQPLREIEQIHRLKSYFLNDNPNVRNYTLVTLGCNTALRISDLLHLKWNDVYSFSQGHFLEHITVHEKKTGKTNCFLLNKSALEALFLYLCSLEEVHENGYVFAGRYGDQQPMSRSQAFRILKKAAEVLDLGKDFSCHSMRKTFGYHAWKQGTNPTVLMQIFNHASFSYTKRYLGIQQEDKDQVYRDINL